MIKQISDFIHLHERLLIAVGILAVILMLGNKWIDHAAIVAGQDKAQANAVLAQQQAVVQQLTATLKDSQAKSDAAVAQANSQILGLQKQISNLQTSLLAEQQSIKTKPVPELTAQWNMLIQIPNGIIDTNDGIVVDEAAARATVSQLVEVPALTQTVQAQTKELAAKDAAIDAQKQTIATADDLIAGLKTQNADGVKACKKDIADAKAVSRKSKRNWFIAGYVAGIATRGLIYLATGL